MSSDHTADQPTPAGSATIPVTDPLGDGGRFYGEIPKPYADEGTIESGGSTTGLDGMIRHYERDGSRKITRAFVNRIENPDGTSGWGVTLYYIAAASEPAE